MNLAVLLAAAEMLIVTPPQFRSEAEMIAELHRDFRQMEVSVVTDSDIATVPDATAVRDYVAQVHADSPLRYLLIIGDGYDETLPDAFYGTLSGGSDPFSAPDIAVGRIPAAIPSQVADYAAKAKRYLIEADTGHHDHILIACDDGDAHEHLDRAEQLASLFTGATLYKAYIDLDRIRGGEAVITRDRITGALRSGIGLMLYTGHGNSTSVTGEGLLDTRLAADLDNTALPWCMFCSCGINAFHQSEPTLAEALIHNRRGGAIGVIAATETVYSSYNSEIARTFVKHRNAVAREETTAGEIWLNTQRDCIAIARRTLNYGFRDNILSYSFAGDPALPLFAPGLAVEAVEAPAEVAPLESFTLSGRIAGTDGDTDTSFSGKITVTVYSPPSSRPTLGQKGDAKGRMIKSDCSPAWQTAATVEKGKFTLSACLPPTGEGRSRVTFHAVTADGSRSAAGVAGLTVAESSGVRPVDDTEPPVIVMACDGDAVTATVSDGMSGVKMSESMAGTDLRLMVDGNKSLAFTTGCLADGSVTLTAPCGNLAEGRHTVLLTAADNAGNRVTASLEFSVKGSRPTVTLHKPDNPARGPVKFIWSCANLDNPMFTLVVTDLRGDTALSVHTSDPEGYTWDTSDVKAGIYTCRLLVADGMRHVHSVPVTVNFIPEK